MSLQSMVLISDPYFNEPGYEREQRTVHGQAASRAYNEDIQWHTLRAAILPQLQNPCPCFAEVLRWVVQAGMLSPCKLGLRSATHVIALPCDGCGWLSPSVFKHGSAPLT